MAVSNRRGTKITDERASQTSSGRGKRGGAYTQWKRHAESNMGGQGFEEETETTTAVQN